MVLTLGPLVGTAVQDLTRAQVETCDAVFVLCNKASASAKQEDLQTVMTILAIGQYIQVCGATT